MTETLLKIKFTETFSKETASASFLQEIIGAIQWFNLDKLAELLPEDADFHDSGNLWEYLAEFKSTLESIEREQPYLNFPLLAVEGNCYHCLLDEVCNTNSKVICFVENAKKPNDVISMVFEFDKDGNLCEMYRCFKASHPTLEMHLGE